MQNAGKELSQRFKLISQVICAIYFANVHSASQLWLFSGPPYEFFFRVKFYVSDPSKLAEEYTR